MKSSIVGDTKKIVDAATTIAVLSPWAAATPAGVPEKAVKAAHDKMVASHKLALDAAKLLTASAKE